MLVKTPCEHNEFDARACREDLYDGDGCPSVHEVANRINDVRLGGMSDMMRQRGDMLLPDQVLMPVSLCFLHARMHVASDDQATSLCCVHVHVTWTFLLVLLCTTQERKPSQIRLDASCSLAPSSMGSLASAPDA
jgi:hypothetical protein